MNAKSFILTLFLFPFLTAAAAQEGLFGISYNTALPLGETSDFVDAYSWRGFSMEGRWFASPQVSAGLFAGWNVFYEKERGDFFDDTQATSGTQLRTINAFPILLTGHYYLGEPGSRRPYFGLGIGTYRTRQETQLGIYASELRKWQFGLAPSAGLLLPVGYQGAHLNLEVRYNYALAAGDALNHSYLGINLGFAWGSY